MNKPYALLTTGYISLDHIIKIESPAQVGFTSLVSNRSNNTLHYGGCPVNIAYALCRLGMPSVPVLRAGKDFESTGFKKFLADGKVPLEGISQIDDDLTSVSYLLEDNHGSHITIFYPGAMDAKYTQVMPDDLFDKAQLGVITVNPMPDNMQFAQKCIDHKLPIVFSMKGDMNAFPSDFLNRVLNYSKVIFTNEIERETIERLLGLKSITNFFDTGIADVIITTRGKKGSIFHTMVEGKMESETIPAFDIFPRIDTTGCGDGYVSGFLYGYLKNYTVRDCCILGSLLSSYVLAKEGCCTNIPTESELIRQYSIYKDRR